MRTASPWSVSRVVERKGNGREGNGGVNDDDAAAAAAASSFTTSFWSNDVLRSHTRRFLSSAISLPLFLSPAGVEVVTSGEKGEKEREAPREKE